MACGRQESTDWNWPFKLPMCQRGCVEGRRPCKVRPWCKQKFQGSHVSIISVGCFLWFGPLHQPPASSLCFLSCSSVVPFPHDNQRELLKTQIMSYPILKPFSGFPVHFRIKCKLLILATQSFNVIRPCPDCPSSTCLPYTLAQAFLIFLQYGKLLHVSTPLFLLFLLPRTFFYPGLLMTH